MIEFVSLLVGLLVGPVEVDMAVGERVAAVVIELDGQRVGELDGPPWRSSVDLGDRLRPHRLTARALDFSGRELDRATRLVNLYRPPAGVDFVLHRNTSGWVTKIELAWPARAGAGPRRTAVSIDGRPVDYDDPSEIYPPPLDPAELHVVEAVAEYPDGRVTHDRLGVGGLVLGHSGTRMTPVLLELGKSAGEPRLEAMVARPAVEGTPARVLGIERGDAEVVFVRDYEAARAVQRITPARATMGALSGARDAQAARTIHALPLADDEWVRLLHPKATPRRGRSLAQQEVPVPLVSDLPGGFGLLWHLKHLEDEDGPEASGAWLADAVAIAGGRAVAAGRRRAAVLLLGAESADRGSLLPPHDARGYLEALRVPLRVWYLGKAAHAPDSWGPVVSVRSVPGMEKALEALRAALDRQRIVWVEGVHLPGEVVIEPISG